MSRVYKVAKRYYDTVLSNGERLWDKDKLHVLVEKKALTKAEYKKITGEEFT
ncbi:XkdX family protein [Bacillota bacterium LCP21S3_D9]